MKEFSRHPVYYVSKMQSSVAFEQRVGVSPCRVNTSVYSVLDVESLIIIINYFATGMCFTKLSTA